MASQNRKKARKALIAFLKRLRKASKTFQTANDCYEFLDQLRALLEQYRQDLPSSSYERLQNVVQSADPARKGISGACQALEFELGHVIEALPVGGALVPVLIGAVVVAAVGVGVAVTQLNVNSAEIVVVNQGCEPIPLSLGMIPGVGQLTTLIGVGLPNQPIPTNGQGSVTLPPITLDIDGTQKDKLNLVVLGMSVPVPMSDDIASLQLDGQPVMGRRMTLDLRDRKPHQLTITCRRR